MIQILLETATDVCSVALAVNGEVVAERTATEVHQHASHLTVFIGEVLERAQVRTDQLDEIILSDGPGSYTSLRVGAATAKGLCVALPGLRLRVVPTLLSVAALARDGRPTLATINSRRGEVYGQLFGPRPQVPGQDESAGYALWDGPQNIRLTEADWYDRVLNAAGRSGFNLTGPGQERVLEHLPEGHQVRAMSPRHCCAVHLLAPALAAGETDEPQTSAVRTVDVASYEPFYLNPPFVTKSKKKPLGR